MSLGLERAGMLTVAFCEIEPFCREVLRRHWPGVPVHDDVRSLSGDAYRGIDVIAGGFPCQDASVAGKGAGLDGERTGLWREFRRLIAECRPRWVLAENVPGLRTRGADRVLSDLEALGYTPRPLVVGAWAVGAPHRRDRVWIVADRLGDTLRNEQGRRCGPSGTGAPEHRGNGETLAHSHSHSHRRGVERRAERVSAEAGESDASGHVVDGCDGAAMDDAKRARLEGHPGHGHIEGRHGGRSAGSVAAPGIRWPAGPGPYQHEWEPPRTIPRTQSGMGSDVDGLPERLVPRERREALRALGNAVVPQVVEAIGRAIMRVA